MSLLDTIRDLDLKPCTSRIHIRLKDRTLLSGVYMEYGYADDNEEGVASIDIAVNGDPIRYGILESEIESITLEAIQ